MKLKRIFNLLPLPVESSECVCAQLQKNACNCIYKPQRHRPGFLWDNADHRVQKEAARDKTHTHHLGCWDLPEEIRQVQPESFLGNDAKLSSFKRFFHRSQDTIHNINSSPSHIEKNMLPPSRAFSTQRVQTLQEGHQGLCYYRLITTENAYMKQ